MVARIIFLFGAIFAVIIGCDIIVHGAWTHYGEPIMLGDAPIPVGILAFIIAGLSVWLGIRKKTELAFKEEEYLICRRCKDTYASNTVPDRHCPKCNIELERLEGFYDRHPDLKDLDEK
ncbi:MAG: hypothetical protein PHT49_09445 [Desulfovibrionales bacterium]|nr:hypothetical protein [Desulfovibrionales bacterium]